MKRTLICAAAALLCLAESAPGRAQTDGGDALRPTRQTTADRSAAMLLALDDRQMDRLDRIYESFARARLEQEAKLAGWQDRLKHIQDWTVPDERGSARLVREIKKGEERIAQAFLRARSDALRVLTGGQRAELDALRSGARPVREDRYYQLLFLTVEDFWKTPVDDEAVRALLDAKAYAARAPRSYPYYGYPAYTYRPYGYGFASLHFGSHHGGSFGFDLGGGHLFGGGHLGGLIGGHFGGGHHGGHH